VPFIEVKLPNLKMIEKKKKGYPWKCQGCPFFTQFLTENAIEDLTKLCKIHRMKNIEVMIMVNF